MKHLPNKQQGFTLLELLVVITLLAVLSVGALVAYEGVGETASSTAQANNTSTTDKAIRSYRAVTGAYPNQWDLLSRQTTAGGLVELDEDSQDFFGEFNLAGISATATGGAIVAAFDAVGVDTLQVYETAVNGVAPNLQHNEGATNGNSDEIGFGSATFLSIVPSGNGAACSVNTAGTSISNNFSGTSLTDNNDVLNKINDFLEDDECHLVVALGFGHDAAHSTFNSSVAISSAPTFTSKDINPANNYARYIALFHVGTDEDEDGIIEAVGDEGAEIVANARLIAVVSPDGTAIDEAVAAATAAN